MSKKSVWVFTMLSVALGFASLGFTQEADANPSTIYYQKNIVVDEQAAVENDPMPGDEEFTNDPMPGIYYNNPMPGKTIYMNDPMPGKRALMNDPMPGIYYNNPMPGKTILMNNPMPGYY